MEKIRVKNIFLFFLFCAGCAHSHLNYDKAETLSTNDEFSKYVKIESTAPAVKPETQSAHPEVKKDASNTAVSPQNTTPATSVKKTKTDNVGTNTAKAKKSDRLVAKSQTKKAQLKKTKDLDPNSESEKRNSSDQKSTNTDAKTDSDDNKKNGVSPEAAVVKERLPNYEDKEGFAPGERRPLVDPFHVGEVVTHSVRYFSVSAGELKLKVEPFQFVNGRKAYTFATEITSSSLFDSFYSASDRAETLVDYEDLTPRTFSLHVKESGQLREARSFFDIENSKANYWEKKVTKKNGEEEKKQQWDMLPFSQNVYSAIFYMRLFKWEVGKEYSFNVADDEKNLMFKGISVRKEKLKTDAGEFDAIVIKPTITTNGVFTPMGDIFFWLSDDEHRYVLRIECKIKIGTLVSEVVKIE